MAMQAAASHAAVHHATTPSSWITLTSLVGTRGAVRCSAAHSPAYFQAHKAVRGRPAQRAGCGGQQRGHVVILRHLHLHGLQHLAMGGERGSTNP